MNAAVHAPPPTGQRQLLPMTTMALDQVMAIEQAAYEFPWTRGNFIDSLHAGYPAWLLRQQPGGELLGYFVAMTGVQEMHLLNITVAPARQGGGHALHMLDALRRLGQNAGASTLWLEVRQSNARARSIYERYGFETVGLRRNYYPAAQGHREDALVMRLTP